MKGMKERREGRERGVEESGVYRRFKSITLFIPLFPLRWSEVTRENEEKEKFSGEVWKKNREVDGRWRFKPCLLILIP